MQTFQKWLENETGLWTIHVTSRHYPKGSYDGVYSTEAEAFTAAAKMQIELRHTGLYCKAVPVPEKHKDELLKYGMVE